jgi:hypothetical protein
LISWNTEASATLVRYGTQNRQQNWFAGTQNRQQNWFAGDPHSAEIAIAHRPLLTQKSLTRTESLPTQKSSMQHCFEADAEIIRALVFD